jgi:hypothetical protein
VPRSERETDRRRGLRFEIVGRLSGSAATVETLRVRNISPSGALVEAPFTLPLHSWHTVHLGADQMLGTVDVRVCHLGASDTPASYLIGLEFVAADPDTTSRLERLIADTATPTC